jgi:hypothetical protein
LELELIKHAEEKNFQRLEMGDSGLAPGSRLRNCLPAFTAAGATIHYADSLAMAAGVFYR